MTNDIPENIKAIWEEGQLAKACGDKEAAMKHFLWYFDLLTIFSQSLNLPYSEALLQQRLDEVRAEIRTFLLDPTYLQTTTLPHEGITEIKLAIGMVAQETADTRQDLIETAVFVKHPTKKALSVEQLTLVELKSKTELKNRVLKVEVTCEGRTQLFAYDTLPDPRISLSTIADQIRTSTGRAFKTFTTYEGTFIVQTGYPSIRNLLTCYLEQGGWLTADEASQIEVVGYPSTNHAFPDVFGVT
ncbi:MAG: hypothetical protein ACW99R_10660 [Candidatus Hodarchaeales archaeon]|jgi:hypothetical protein